VYKEFLEIANEIIPQILRMDHSGMLTSDPAAYALLLRFYDGLCCWEEDSQTPVLHITWATHMLSSISKFDAKARTAIEVVDTIGAGDDDVCSVDKTSVSVNSSGGLRPHNVQTRHSVLRTSRRSHDSVVGGLQVAPVEFCESGGSAEVSPFCGDNQLTSSSDEMKMRVVVERLAGHSDVGIEADEDGDCSSEIAALAQACGDSLLNPEFLRGTGEPFVKSVSHQLLSSATNTQVDLNAFVTSTGADQSVDVTTTSAHEADSERKLEPDRSAEQRPRLTLCSAKMSALKQLLVAAKLNSSAIKLHLTAQSQVARKPAHIRRPLSAQFYSDSRHGRANKRRAND